jgi:hypothetical protein
VAPFTLYSSFDASGCFLIDYSEDMAPFFHGFAALTGNVRIAKDAVCDKNKPNTFLIQCDVQVEKIGAMNIQVCK